MNARTLFTAAITAVCLLLLLCLSPVNAAVVRQDDSILSQTSGVPAYVWSEETAPLKAAVVIVHGFTQQGRSAEALASRLAQDKYLVVSMDQRGHGRWHYGRSGDGRAVDYKASINDVERMVKTIKDLHPELSVYLLGESAGSGIVAEAACQPECCIDGVILSSPGCRPRVFNPFWVVKDFLCNVYRLNHPVDLRRYIKTYASDDPRVVQEMIDEPLDRNTLTGREILRTVAFIRHTKKAVKHISEDVPLLVVQGGQDHILQRHTVRAMYHDSKSRDKNMLYFPEYGHVLVGTSYIRPEVADGIENWLDKRYRNVSLSASARIMQAPAAAKD